MTTKIKPSWRFWVRKWILEIRYRLTGKDYTTICRKCGRNAGNFNTDDLVWQLITNNAPPLCWGCFGRLADQYTERAGRFVWFWVLLYNDKNEEVVLKLCARIQAGNSTHEPELTLEGNVP